MTTEADLAERPPGTVPAPEVPGSRAARPCFELAFRRDGSGRSFVGAQYVRYPVHVGRGLHTDGAAPDMCVVYLQSVSGGLFEHDQVDGRIEVAAGAAAHVATPASTVVHAMSGGSAGQTAALIAAPGALLEYMPAPVILFPGSHLRSRTTVSLAPDALVLVAETFLAHDHAGGGDGFARFESAVVVSDEAGTLLARERMRIDGDAWRAATVAVAAGMRVHGSLWVLRRGAGDVLHAALLDAAAAAEADGAYAGASRLPGDAGVVFRVLGPDAVSVERAQHRAWSAVRTVHAGRAPALRRR